MSDTRKILSEVTGAPQQTPGPQRQWRDSLKVSDRKLYDFLLAASNEAYENTGDAAGEYGTLHYISELPPSQRQAGIDKALVYKTITDMGPDISWERMAPMMRKVRTALGGMSVVDAWKKNKLGNILDRAGAFGPSSDTMRHSGDKYY